MPKTFTLRIDLESDKGIRLGLPKLLDLLKKHNIKASFYIPMGGESNIFEILKYRKAMESSGERKIKVFSLLDKIKMALFPMDFVKSNIKLLRRILKEGHELGIHAWKHREWTRGLSRIDVEKRIIQSKKKYLKLLGKKPISFASPGFNINKEVVSILEKHGFKYISDFPGKSIKKYSEIKNVPMTILGKNKMPIIEYLTEKEKPDEEIIKEIKKQILKNNLSSIYIHGLFEARFKLNILNEVFRFIKIKKIKAIKIINY